MYGVTVWPVIALSPSLFAGVHVTRADCDAASAATPVGAGGPPAPTGVTAFAGADTAPAPLAFSACTVNVYVVPVVSPVTVVLVAGGEPLTTFGACAVEPTYGVTLYAATRPPPDGAVHHTRADVPPLSAAVTPGPRPGAGLADSPAT